MRRPRHWCKPGLSSVRHGRPRAEGRGACRSSAWGMRLRRCRRRRLRPARRGGGAGRSHAASSRRRGPGRRQARRGDAHLAWSSTTFRSSPTTARTSKGDRPRHGRRDGGPGNEAAVDRDLGGRHGHLSEAGRRPGEGRASPRADSCALWSVPPMPWRSAGKASRSVRLAAGGTDTRRAGLVSFVIQVARQKGFVGNSAMALNHWSAAHVEGDVALPAFYVVRALIRTLTTKLPRRGRGRRTQLRAIADVLQKGTRPVCSLIASDAHQAPARLPGWMASLAAAIERYARRASRRARPWAGSRRDRD